MRHAWGHKLQRFEASSELEAWGCHPHYFKFSIAKLPPLAIGQGITGLGSRQLNHIADWKVACSMCLTRLS